MTARAVHIKHTASKTRTEARVFGLGFSHVLTSMFSAPALAQDEHPPHGAPHQLGQPSANCYMVCPASGPDIGPAEVSFVVSGPVPPPPDPRLVGPMYAPLNQHFVVSGPVHPTYEQCFAVSGPVYASVDPRFVDSGPVYATPDQTRFVDSTPMYAAPNPRLVAPGSVIATPNQRFAALGPVYVPPDKHSSPVSSPAGPRFLVSNPAYAPSDQPLVAPGTLYATRQQRSKSMHPSLNQRLGPSGPVYASPDQHSVASGPLNATRKQRSKSGHPSHNQRLGPSDPAYALSDQPLVASGSSNATRKQRSKPVHPSLNQRLGLSHQAYPPPDQSPDASDPMDVLRQVTGAYEAWMQKGAALHSHKSAASHLRHILEQGTTVLVGGQTCSLLDFIHHPYAQCELEHLATNIRCLTSSKRMLSEAAIRGEADEVEYQCKKVWLQKWMVHEDRQASNHSNVLRFGDMELASMRSSLARLRDASILAQCFRAIVVASDPQAVTALINHVEAKAQRLSIVDVDVLVASLLYGAWGTDILSPGSKFIPPELADPLIRKLAERRKNYSRFDIRDWTEWWALGEAFRGPEPSCAEETWESPNLGSGECLVSDPQSNAKANEHRPPSEPKPLVEQESPEEKKLLDEQKPSDKPEPLVEQEFLDDQKLLDKQKASDKPKPLVEQESPDEHEPSDEQESSDEHCATQA
eukprot:Blabericola_migrator_1__5015@NODE_2600_length_2554_cov_93_507841_g1630_i0_p1_GENE_NODE_2600_length_2554_cov_93_507841_g1630_i0NODE_2600_length_2554_cov_93_507841_g1630_i0_p1_ORF_typecomplete_len694_score59_39Cellsynth_D/PF03500_13/0_029_NODE_2600_length_2554_cov_93_507841_g1630_i02072288